MQKQIILILRGLPSSGKSTFTQELLKNEPGRWKAINKDLLRAMVDGGKWTRDNEKLILDVRDLLIEKFLSKGFSVVIDDTNFGKHEQHIRDLFGDRAKVEVKFFDVPVEECVKRDLIRSNSVGAEVIYQMYNQYLFNPNVYKPDATLPPAILVDIDGSLAKNVGRGFFDWHKVGCDLLNEHVALIVKALKAQGIKIIILSGRDAICKAGTKQWLADKDVEYDEFYMRPEGNMEGDEIIKERIYRENIDGRFVVKLVLDDRPRVRRLWLRLGIPILDCNQDFYKVEF